MSKKLSYILYKKLPYLTIIPQRAPHEDAEIIGNRAGLVALKDAIQAALSSVQDFPIARQEEYAPDGEAYTIVVREHTTDAIQMMNPRYTDKDFA